jgi:hypothetical protein
MTGMRTFAIATFAALALAGSAYAAYPGTYAQPDSYGLVSGSTRFTVSQNGASTHIDALNVHSLALRRSANVDGKYGVPTMIPANVRLGMFRDGTSFVLQSVANQSQTSFVVVRTSDLSVLRTISLKGSFSFDALSPDGTRLYLIQHTSDDFQHYVVRAYDLTENTLLPGRIADKTQRGWVMRGWPVSRVATANGRWVYTLYTNPSGFPFVHALDTVKGVAHCVGIAWKGSQDELTSYRLRVAGNRLLVLAGSGAVYRSIDRTTWSVRLR